MHPILGEDSVEKAEKTELGYYGHERTQEERKDDQDEWKTGQGTSFHKASIGAGKCFAQQNTLAPTESYSTLQQAISFGVKYRNGRMTLDSTLEFPSIESTTITPFISSLSLLPMNDDWSGGWFDEQPTKKGRACFERALSHSL